MFVSDLTIPLLLTISRFTDARTAGAGGTTIAAQNGPVSSSRTATVQNTATGTGTGTVATATNATQSGFFNLPPASGGIKGMNYNAQAGYDWTGQFNIAKSFGFNSARLYTMIEPNTNSTPIAALQAAALSNTSVLLGIWLENPLSSELAALRAAMSIPGLRVVGMSCGSEDLYRNTHGGVGASAGNITSCISQVKAIIGNRFPVGHTDVYQNWNSADGITVAAAADFIGYNGYPYWEGSAPDAVSVVDATSRGLSNITAAGITKPVWIAETGWPVSGQAIGPAVPSPQNAETFYQAVGCGMMFGKYNTWWYTLDDSSLAPPHFGVTSGPGQTQPLYNLACTNGHKYRQF